MKTISWEVVVSNIGNISCRDRAEAERTFEEYVRQSKTGRGRAGGESVTMFRDDEIVKEYEGTQGNPRKARTPRAGGPFTGGIPRIMPDGTWIEPEGVWNRRGFVRLPGGAKGIVALALTADSFFSIPARHHKLGKGFVTGGKGYLDAPLDEEYYEFIPLTKNPCPNNLHHSNAESLGEEIEGWLRSKGFIPYGYFMTYEEGQAAANAIMQDALHRNFQAFVVKSKLVNKPWVLLGRVNPAAEQTGGNPPKRIKGMREVETWVKAMEKAEYAGPSEGDYIIQSDDTIAQEGRVIATKREYGDGPDAWIRAHMEKEKFWPDVWSLDDHGGWMLLVWDEGSKSFVGAVDFARARLRHLRMRAGNPVAQYKVGQDIQHEGHYDRTHIAAPSRKKLIVMGTKGLRSGPASMLGKVSTVTIKTVSNPGRTQIGRKCVLIETSKGKCSGNMGGVYGLKGGDVFIQGFFKTVPDGVVTAIEYMDEEKAKRENLTPADRPWRHDFTKERVGLRRCKGGLLMKAGARPLWGIA